MIDGVWTPDEAGKKYLYQSNQYFLCMDTRPGDPNVLYERTLMICWWLGCSLHVESQKPGVIRYFQSNNCHDFLLNKYVPVETKSRTIADEKIVFSFLCFDNDYHACAGFNYQYLEKRSSPYYNENYS